MSASELFTTTLQGGSGIPFDDTPSDTKNSRITKIVLYYAGDIRSLEVTYSGGNQQVINHGSKTSTRVEFKLLAGEYITQIRGNASEKWVFKLKFITNQRTHGPFGKSEGESFIWQGPVGTALRPVGPMRLLAFSGNISGDYLAGLRGIFCELPINTMRTIQYENRSKGAQGVSPLNIVSSGPSESFSSFTIHLMNPTIGLFVGEDRVQFYAHKDTLCQLPFFQAALSGGFKEASEQVITLPEDKPSHVSALIEFLYTGNYTYTYTSNPDATPRSDGSAAPAGDKVEGMFHIGVYVVASKYDCQELVQIAARHIEYVENELDGIDVLHLWKAAYEVDMRYSARTMGPRSGGGLAKWVTKMFKEHREEMEKAFAEFPMLASDLLCTVAASDD